ncbi:La-related protein 6 [Phytophthora cinnamomi]|uniref:La-related protein 6 n=1 Tax=Phytophthora cinnamomi TaxID=4785 RepID=UPI00355979CE|nr:La-related protein 6 [Phytophthora cinnamomi]
MQLEVAAWVLRHHPALQAALPHLVPLVSDFLGPDPNLSLTKACKLGSTRLLDWLWERSCVSADARPDGWSLCHFLRSDPHYYRYQFHEAIEVAAGQGDVSVVTWLMDHFSGCEVPSDAVAAAAYKGHLSVLQLLLEKDAGRGRPHKVDRVELENDEWEDSVPVMPTNWSGPGNVVRWGSNPISHAVAASKVEVARWLCDNTPHQSSADDVNRIVERAVVNGDFEIAEFLLPRGRKIADYVGYLMGPQAAEPMLQRGYLKDNKIAAIGAIWVAAREGNLDLMKRIAAQHPKPPRGKNSEWLQCWGYAMTSACEGGDVEMIKWMMEHPTGRLLCKQMKEDTIMDNYDELLHKAAEGGRIEALEYLVAQGCRDEYAYGMVNAARKGHVNCIEWLLEHTYQYHPQ